MKGFEGYNDLERKRVSIRKRIRRDDLDNYFEQRRRELLAAYQAQSSSNLREELETNQKRYCFLGKINQELNQKPPSEWNSLIEELEMSLPYFQGNFDQFLNFQIIEILTSVVCQNHYRLRIQHSILKILTQITNRQKVDNPKILEKIILTNIIFNSINFMHSVDMPLDQQFHFLYFYASIARINEKFRNGLLDHGVGRLIVNYASKVLQTNERNEDLCYSLLGICSDFLKVFRVKQVKQRYPNFAFVEPLLPLIIAFLSEGGSDRIIKISLLCLMLIVKTRNQQYFKRFFQSNIVPYILSLTKVPMFAYDALNIISNLASSEVDENTQQLSKMGIKDELYQKNRQEDVDYRVVVLSLNIIDNLLTCKEEAMDSMNHHIWEILCRSLEHRENAVKIEAFHCLNTIISVLQDPHLQFQVLKKNKFIELAISQLQDFKKRQPQLIQECLILLDKYINLSVECDNMQAFHILESIYKLSTLFQAMLPQIQNEIVLDKVSTVYDCYMQKFIHVSL